VTLVKGIFMRRKELVISILLHSSLLIVIYVFQGVIFPFMRFIGLVPLLLPIATAGVALYEGRDTGGITGLFAGILCDVSFNQPVGAFTVLLTFSGLVIGTLADTLIVKGFLMYYLCCIAILIASAFVQMFPLVVLQNILPQALMRTAIQQTLYSLIFAFPIWFFIRALGKHADRVTSSGRAL